MAIIPRKELYLEDLTPITTFPAVSVILVACNCSRCSRVPAFKCCKHRPRSTSYNTILKRILWSMNIVFQEGPHKVKQHESHHSKNIQKPPSNYWICTSEPQTQRKPSKKNKQNLSKSSSANSFNQKVIQPKWLSNKPSPRFPAFQADSNSWLSKCCSLQLCSSSRNAPRPRRRTLPETPGFTAAWLSR